MTDPTTAPRPDPTTAGDGAPFERVELRRVTKTYGAMRALAGVDLALEAGRACALLGPNGAGKSTLVRVLSTLMRPTAGEVRFGELSVGASGAQGGARLRAAIGMLAHDAFVYGDLSGEENLRFFGGLYDVPEPARQARAWMERVGLSGAAARPARTYSRGMLQRLALARTLLHRPKLVLLDEPFTGLDREGTATLSALLAEAKGEGRILVVVSHDLESLSGLADHVAVLRRGRVVSDERAPAGAAFGAAELRDVYARTAPG